jgi:hypothetical protein
MTIRATVRNGQIELDSPLDLPDGTVLSIPVPDSLAGSERSRESIAEWEQWYKALEPWTMTDEERAAWDAARQEDKEFELSQWETRSQAVEKLFP